MQEIINIIKELRTLSGNAQLEFLRTHKDNELLKEILLYSSNPDLQFHVKEAKFNKIEDKCNTDNTPVYVIGNSKGGHWEYFKTKFLIPFSEQKGVKDFEIEAMILFMSILSEDIKDLFKCVLFKDEKTGMGISSYNKVWSDFKFDFPYLGASGLTDKNMNKIKYPCLAQNKEDGLFCNGIVDILKNKVEYMSRQGKPLLLGNLLDDELKVYASQFGYDKLVFTGEIRVLADESIFNYLLQKAKSEEDIKALGEEELLIKKYLPRELSNGLLRDEKRPLHLNNFIRYIIWDYIPWGNFVNKHFGDICIDRFNNLNHIINAFDFDYLTIPDYIIANNYEEILDYFQVVRNNKEEGLVIKNFDSIWKDTKSLAFKFKAKEDCDLQIIDFIEGKGALEGACGAVYCKSSDDKLFVHVKPRTPDLCKYVWENKEEFLNKILMVEYNEKKLGQDKVIYTLNHPVWSEVRVDKDVADKLEDIK